MVEQLESKVAPLAGNGWRSWPLPFDANRALSRRPWAVPLIGLSLAIGFGLLARLRHIAPYDFPLNDGGMFYSMVRDIQSSHYLLPAHTSYNSISIPFAYPPFPFYLAAAIDDVTPFSLLDVLRFLPLVANLLTIIVVYLLARALLRSRTPVPELAAIIFALLPRSYRWLIMGGGLTRSLAFLFALAAIHQTLLLYQRGDRKLLLGAIAFASLTALSHPEVSWYLGYSLALLLLCYGRKRTAVINSFWLVAGVALITAPWWASVLAREGAAPFLSAAQTGGHSSDIWRAFLSWDFDELIGLNWPAMLAIMGAIVCIAGGELFLPVWLVISIVLEPRSGATYIMVPVALLSALAIVRFALPLLRAQLLPAAGGAVAVQALPAKKQSAIGALWDTAPNVAARALPLVAVALFVFYIGFLSVREVLLLDPALTAVSQQDRAAFQWVRNNTPAGSQFLVVTGTYNPFADSVSEWFPALTKRQSVATLQGYEWLGVQRYLDQWDRFYYLQSCQDASCIESRMAEHGSDARYVYVARQCCWALMQSLRLSYDFSLQYEGPSAAVFVRRY